MPRIRKGPSRMTTAKSFDDRAYIKAALALGHLLMHPSSAYSSPSPPPVTSANLRPTSSPSPCNANPVFLLAGNEEPINLSEAYSYDERQASSAYHFVQSSVVSVHARNSYYFDSQDIVNHPPYWKLHWHHLGLKGSCGVSCLNRSRSDRSQGHPKRWRHLHGQSLGL